MESVATAGSPVNAAERPCKAHLEMCRASETKIWEDVLRAFNAADNIDFAYPTTRYYSNVSEGKPGARASAPVPMSPTAPSTRPERAAGHRPIPTKSKV